MLSPEKEREKKAAAAKEYRKRKHASMSPDEREAERAKKAAAAKEYRKRKHASMSPDEREAEMARKAAAAKRRRQQKRAASIEESTGESCDYEIGVATTSPIQQARNHDQKRIMGIETKCMPRRCLCTMR